MSTTDYICERRFPTLNIIETKGSFWQGLLDDYDADDEDGHHNDDDDDDVDDDRDDDDHH